MGSYSESSNPATCIDVLFEALDYPTALIGTRGQYRAVNSAYAALLRAETGALLARAFADSLHPDDRESCDILIARIARGGAERGSMAKRLLVSGGAPVETSLSFSRLGGTGSVDGILITAIPVAPRGSSLPRMGDADHPLAQMSHELRTPLNAIMGFSELIKSETLGPIGNERYREYADDIHRSGHRLLSVISGLLESAR